MENEFLGALWGAIAGGLVSLAIEGLKGWANRRRAAVTASMALATQKGKPAHYSFSITVVNAGGKTLHIVRYGIQGPAKLDAKQRAKVREIREMRRNIAGWRGWFHRVDSFSNIMTYNEVLELPPGKPHSRRDATVPDSVGLELNTKAVAFAEDSLGRRYTCRVNVPDHSSLGTMRTQAEQALAQQSDASASSPSNKKI